MGGQGEGQKERFSRAFVVAAACAAEADFTCYVPTDDIEGVDMVVSQGGMQLDFQLKSTTDPIDKGANFLFDLEVRTYDLLSNPVRCGMGVLALIVLHAEWMFRRYWEPCDRWSQHRPTRQSNHGATSATAIRSW